MRANPVILLFALLLMPAFVFAGVTGKLKGKITDRDNKEALIGANVQLEGSSVGAASDINGEYTVSNVTAGTYVLLVVVTFM